jgi:2'-hydroxyisoflavone reductase
MTGMRLLVVGGTRFAGRAVVEAALAAGMDVTTVNRGQSGPPARGVTALTADRTDLAGLRAALGDGEWDAAIDTWSGAPRVIAVSSELLAGRVGWFGYVSTVSVYADPFPAGADEAVPTVEADPDSADSGDYQAAKRGAELAVLRAFGEDRVLLARPGLILGPYENVGRLPWWLRRVERGGRVLAPGDPACAFQYVDVRDLAAWLLRALADKVTGPFNVVNRPGQTTFGELLSLAVEVTGQAGAELVWTPQDVILAAGIQPWTELPIWLPNLPEYAGMDTIDSAAAYAAGLTGRPLRDTVTAAWAWLQAEGAPKPNPGRPPLGLDPAKERQVLDGLT